MRVTDTLRRPIIAGNWKMHTTAPEGAALAEAIRSSAIGLEGVDLVLCPPFTGLSAVAEGLRGSAICLGAQNMHWEQNGPFTGEISAKMLLTLGCSHVILGHSERRAHFGETDEMVHRKVVRALNVGLTPIICVGETIEQREANQTTLVVTTQVRGVLTGLSFAELGRIVLAYEPVWAIGTGRVATPEQANEVHRHIRAQVAELSDNDLARQIRIQYGGSVKPENAAVLLAESDIDGGLIGGASLDAMSFLAIARAAVD